MESRKQRVVLLALAAASLAATFAQNWFVLALLGPGAQSDSLMAGLMIPQFILAVGQYVFGNSLIPVLAPLELIERRAAGWYFLLRGSIVTVVLAVLLVATTGFWAPTLFPSLARNESAMLVEISRVQVVGVMFSVPALICWSLMRADGQAFLVECSFLVANLIALVLIFVGIPKFGAIAAAWAFAGKSAVQLLILAPALGRPVLTSGDERPWRREVLSRGAALSQGAVFFKATIIAERMLGSTASAGGLSMFVFAQQCVNAVEQLVARSIVAANLPPLSRYWHDNNLKLFNRTVKVASFEILIFVGGVWLVLLVFGDVFLPFVFQHGKFTSDDILLLRTLLIVLVGQMIASPIANVVNSAFYAAGIIRTPTMIGVSTTILGIWMRWYGTESFGIVGMASAVSIQYFVAITILLPCFYHVLLRRHAKN